MLVSLSGMSEASRRNLLAMHTSDAWLTLSELGKGASSASLTLMAIRTDPWVERRFAEWGGEEGQKRGRGYEYRLTDEGRKYRQAVLEASW